MTAPVAAIPSSKNSALGPAIVNLGLNRLGISPAVSQSCSPPAPPSGPAMNPSRDIDNAVPITLIRLLLTAQLQLPVHATNESPRERPASALGPNPQPPTPNPQPPTPNPQPPTP